MSVASQISPHAPRPVANVVALCILGAVLAPSCTSLHSGVKNQHDIRRLPVVADAGNPDHSIDAPQDEVRFVISTPTLGHTLLADQKEFYSSDSLIALTMGIAAGSAIANTNVDRKLHQQFHRDFQGDDATDVYEFLHANKELGNGMYTLPIFATSWAVGELWDDSPGGQWTGDWGERSLRSFLVGAPPMLLFQRATGASRPGESNHESRWHLFHDSNGVSGHSFMGALPFINAAKMTDDPWLKFAFYAGSTLAPLSRVNDDAHYPSQAALGWWFAYLASSAVDQTESSEQRWRVRPAIDGGATGVAFEVQY